MTTTSAPTPHKLDKADQIPMTKGVLDEIIAAARQGYFVRDVQFIGSDAVFRVFYDALKPDPQIVTYAADGHVVPAAALEPRGRVDMPHRTTYLAAALCQAVAERGPFDADEALVQMDDYYTGPAVAKADVIRELNALVVAGAVSTVDGPDYGTLYADAD